MSRPSSVVVELQKLDGTWVNVSADVVLNSDEGIEITRGCTDEDGQPDAAQCTLTFEARDKRYTHGDSTYDCRAEQPVYVGVVVNGVTYPRFVGTISSWPAEWDGPTAGLMRSTVSAYDRLARLGRRRFRSLIQEQYTYDQPAAYWMLADDSAADSAGELAGGGTALALQPFGNVTFGDVSSPIDGQGQPTIAAASHLSLDVRALNLQRGSSTGWSFEAVITTTAGAGHVLLGLLTPLSRAGAANDYVNVYLQVDTGGTLIATLVASNNGTNGTTKRTKVINDGKPHHIGVSVVGNTMTVYCDGIAGVTPYVAPGGTPIPGGKWDTLYVGLGDPNGPPNTAAMVASHVAVFPLPATAGDATDRGSVVAGTALGSAASTRLQKLLTYARGNVSPGSNPMLTTTVNVQGTGHTLAAQANGEGSALEMMQTVAYTEAGLLDMKPGVRTSALRLVTGRQIMSNAGGTPVATLAAGDVDGVPFLADTRDLVNDVSGSRIGGGDLRVYDADSIAAYGVYEKDLSGLLLTSDDDALDRMRWELGTGKDVSYRVSSLAVDIQAASTAVTQAILSCDLGSRVQVTGLPSSSPVGGTADLLVRGWTERLQGDVWEWDANTELAAAWQMWILDDPTFSVLDSTTKLGF